MRLGCTRLDNCGRPQVTRGGIEGAYKSGRVIWADGSQFNTMPLCYYVGNDLGERRSSW